MREIFVEKREELIRIAVKENGELVECLVEGETKNRKLERFIRLESRI